MPIQVLMPALSPTMEKGNLAKWLKKEGEPIKSGDVIAEIETDKATMEVEATDEGTLGKILIPEGTADVAVNTPIATILADGESAADLGKAPAPPAEQKAAESAPPAAAKAEAPQPQSPLDKAPAAPHGRRRARSGSARRHRDDHADHPRGAARRHGRGDAPRPRCLHHGRGGRGISGRLQGHAGPAAGIRRQARDRHADHRARLCRRRRRRGDGRPEADRRVHDLQFRHAGDRPDHQLRRQDALYVRRPDGLLDRVPRARTAPPRASPPSTARTIRPGTRKIPGLKVIAPFSAADYKGLLKAAIRDPNPVIFLENEMLYGHSGEVPKLDDYVMPIGKARVARTGKDVTIISWSNGMTYALKAAEELAKEGIEAEVIDLRTLRPMDTETIVASVKKTGRAVTVEEGWQQNGVGAEIAARIMEHAFDYLDAPVARVSGKDVPMPYAANLEKLALPSVAEVVEAAKAVRIGDAWRVPRSSHCRLM